MRAEGALVQVIEEQFQAGCAEMWLRRALGGCDPRKTPSARPGAPASVCKAVGPAGVGPNGARIRNQRPRKPRKQSSAVAKLSERGRIRK